jgi:predicted SnoaL-like aldol condensation-catalyzing enzyme
MPMKTIELNRAVACRAIEEIWNQHNLDAIDVLYAPNYVTCDLGARAMPDREGLKQLVSQTVAAAPNARVSIDLMLAEGDKVALRYKACNGHGATVTGALVVRVVHGQIRESWGATRMVELLCRVSSAAA